MDKWLLNAIAAAVAAGFFSALLTVSQQFVLMFLPLPFVVWFAALFLAIYCYLLIADASA